MVKYIAKRITISKDNKNSKNWRKFGYKHKRPPITRDNTLCYKLMIGFNIFYVSEKVYKKCLKEGLIDLSEKEISTNTFENIEIDVGLNIFFNISHAIAHSTFKVLKSTLQKVNDEPKIIKIICGKCQEYDDYNELLNPSILLPQDTIYVDIESREIIYNDTDTEDVRNPLRLIRDYEFLLDFLADEVDLTGCNSGDLTEKRIYIFSFLLPVRRCTVKYPDEKELRTVMSEEDYLKHYEKMVLGKEARNEELKMSEDCALSAIHMGFGLSLAGIEIVELFGDLT